MLGSGLLDDVAVVALHVPSETVPHMPKSSHYTAVSLSAFLV